MPVRQNSKDNAQGSKSPSNRKCLKGAQTVNVESFLGPTTASKEAATLDNLAGSTSVNLKVALLAAFIVGNSDPTHAVCCPLMLMRPTNSEAYSCIFPLVFGVRVHLPIPAHLAEGQVSEAPGPNTYSFGFSG